MRYHDEDEAARLNAEPWMLDLLKLNPEYLGWGPHEDYMIVKGNGWNSPQTFATWADFGPWKLNDLNECVNFYFSVDRASKDCTTCGGSGTHPDAQWVADSFYSHSSPFKSQSVREQQAEAIMRVFGSDPKRTLGYDAFPSEELLSKYGAAFREFCEDMRKRGHWSDAITQDEVQALVDDGRLKDFTHTFAAGEGWKKKEPAAVPTAAEVNEWERGRGMGHDAINRWVLIRRRCERLGLPVSCPTCEGEGHVYTEPQAHVSLTLWWLHPRKCCSRGLEVARIQQSDLPAVYAFLREAADRNAERFSLIPDHTSLLSDKGGVSHG